MTLDFSTAAGASVLVLADISRGQRKSADRNTLFRILVDGNVVMQTNTGAASMMGYHSVTLHAVAAGLAAGEHTAEVQCRLPSAGAVSFASGSKYGEHSQHV